MSTTTATATRDAAASIARERELQNPDDGSCYSGASTDRRATPKQLYRIARETLELLGLAWPNDRRAASELIGQLAEANKARRHAAGASSSGDPMAF